MPTVGPPLSPALVTRLQSVHGYPCISLLLGTRPGRTMAGSDAVRLDQLRLNAVSRLHTEDLLEPERNTVRDLDRLVEQAVSGPTERGLAIYVGQGIARAVLLPTDVADRVVVDPTFATRDLVRALHRTPRHVVLVLGGRRASLYDGAGGRLSPTTGTQFPIDLHVADGRFDVQAWTPSLRVVDQSLGTYLRLHPAPIVVAGPQRLVSVFRALSGNLTRLAGTVPGRFDEAGPIELARRTRPVLRRYLRSRERAALVLLDERRGADRVASGIATAWLAARTERPEMLVVEEGYVFPARLSADGDQVTPADDAEAPDVIDDLVDELIEVVLERGGWVALARDGTLTAHARVALTLG